MQAEGTAVIPISRVFGFLFWDELRGEKKRAAGECFASRRLDSSNIHDFTNSFN